MAHPPAKESSNPPNRPAGRPWIGMHFACCNAYRRIYLTRDGAAFAGHCPKCAKPVRIPVGEGGESGRFWSAE